MVPTPSMEKTISTGVWLFINKFVFGASTPIYIPFANIELPYFRFPAIREPERNEILVFYSFFLKYYASVVLNFL